MAAGYGVVAIDLDETGLETLPSTVVALAGDAADEDLAAKAVTAATRRFGGVSLIVNSVGSAGPTARTESMSIADGGATLRANVTSHFLLVAQRFWHCAPVRTFSYVKRRGV